MPPIARPRRIVGVSLKMYFDLPSTLRYIDAVSQLSSAAQKANVDLFVIPDFVTLLPSAEKLKDTNIQLGAQDCYSEDKGAFTGEVSASMLVDLRCTWVLVGHSERRQLFGETDEAIAQKVAQALGHGLRPVICLGETLEERRSEVTEAVLARQLDAVMPVLRPILRESAGEFVLAYEPVWAIGTGLTATPEQAQEVHAFIRKRIAASHGDPVGGAVRILYGGSVNARNAADIFAVRGVDGALVGGASLKAVDFLPIVEAAAAAG